MITVGILLAAGHSRRFGGNDKLLADFQGQPLACHAAQALIRADVTHLVAVVSSSTVADVLPGFERTFVEDGPREQSDSLKAGISRARDLSADRALVTLGDMPLVGAELVDAILARGGTRQASATTDGARRMPPACFPKSLFDALLNTQGDRGAAPILRDLPESQLVQAPAGQLTDIDSLADLERLQNMR
ncbi:MAG: nucleotidyltransferase family protein [Rhodobacteraceae bacterium]|nr:nucleotidyltransferase family protein [Paracoccaceae bacterium]